jgi:hypothetical protein
MPKQWTNYLAVLSRENGIPKSLSFEEMIKEYIAQKSKGKKLQTHIKQISSGNVLFFWILWCLVCQFLKHTLFMFSSISWNICSSLYLFLFCFWLGERCWGLKDNLCVCVVGCVVQGIKPRALHMLGKHSTTDLTLGCYICSFLLYLKRESTNWIDFGPWKACTHLCVPAGCWALSFPGDNSTLKLGSLQVRGLGLRWPRAEAQPSPKLPRVPSQDEILSYKFCLLSSPPLRQE